MEKTGVFTCFIIAALHLTQVESGSSADLMLEIMDKTAPCTLSCIFSNLENFIEDFATKQHCLPELQQMAAGIFNFSMMAPQPPPSGGSGPNMLPPNPNDMLKQIYSGQMCPLIEKGKACIFGLLSKYCSGSLSSTLKNQLKDIIQYYGCGEPNADKAKLLKCAIEPKAAEVGTQCIGQVTQNYQGVFAGKEYPQIYEEVLATNKICTIAQEYTKCYLDTIRDLKLSSCGNDVLDTLRNEINAMLEIINCHPTKTNPYYDGLKCLANPALILNEIPPCINQKVTPQLQGSAETLDQPPFIKLKYNQMCDAIDLVDSCIEDEMVAQPACRNDGWTLSTYRKLAGPLRDFLLLKHCPQTLTTLKSECALAKHWFTLPQVSISCPKIYSDFKPLKLSDYDQVTPCAELPEFLNGATYFLPNFLLLLTSAILSAWLMLVLHI